MALADLGPVDIGEEGAHQPASPRLRPARRGGQLGRRRLGVAAGRGPAPAGRRRLVADAADAAAAGSNSRHPSRARRAQHRLIRCLAPEASSRTDAARRHGRPGVDLPRPPRPAARGSPPPGCRKTSAPAPLSTTLPAFSTATRSQTRRTTSISWVISTMVRPSSRLSWSISVRMLRPSSPGPGRWSPRRTAGRSGPVARARAMPTRCFWPPDSWAGCLFAMIGQADAAPAASAPAPVDLGARRAREPQREGDIARRRCLDDSRLKFWKIMPMRRRSARSPARRPGPVIVVGRRRSRALRSAAAPSRLISADPGSTCPRPIGR